ncbi:DUF6444 domain-containing protein [Photobacterium sanguinicancri]
MREYEDKLATNSRNSSKSPSFDTPEQKREPNEKRSSVSWQT